MVESTAPRKPAGVARAHEKIQNHYASNPTMRAEEVDLDLISRIVTKMPARNQRETASSTIDMLFEIALSKLKDDDDKAVVANLRKTVAQVEEDLYRPKPRYIDAFFFPNLENVRKLERYIKMAKRSLLICVFNLTNDVLANAVKHVADQGVDVRVITDDECMTNKGNDCQALANHGIPVRTDNETQFHMHNKFMVVDKTFLLTGSFNWTFQAGKSNQENLLVVDHPFYIEKYVAEFEKLWTEFANQEVRAQERAARTIQKAYRGKQSQQKAKQVKQSGGNPKAISAPGWKFNGW